MYISLAVTLLIHIYPKTLPIQKASRAQQSYQNSIQCIHLGFRLCHYCCCLVTPAWVKVYSS